MTKFCALIWISFFCVSFVLIQKKEKFSIKEKTNVPLHNFLSNGLFVANYLCYV